MPREVLAKSAKIMLGDGDRLPEPLVLEHEALPVDRQLGLEVALRVAVAVLGEPRVALRDAPHPKLGPDEPRDLDVGLLADLEPEAADRQRVRRRREAEIDVDAVLELGRTILSGPQSDDLGELLQLAAGEGDQHL